MVTWQKILENHGKLVSLNFNGTLYPECEINFEDDEIHFMNNFISNANNHRNKRKYKYSLNCKGYTYYKNNFKNVIFLNQSKTIEIW